MALRNFNAALLVGALLWIWPICEWSVTRNWKLAVLSFAIEIWAMVLVLLILAWRKHNG
jgi:hypothetical protein